MAGIHVTSLLGITACPCACLTRSGRGAKQEDEGHQPLLCRLCQLGSSRHAELSPSPLGGSSCRGLLFL